MKERLHSLFRLALPVYVELLSGVLCGIVDTFWVTRLGRDAVAVVTLATNLENVLHGLILVVSAGVTVLVARRSVQGDLQGVRQAVTAGWRLSVALALVVGVAGILGRYAIGEAFGLGNTPAGYLGAMFAGVLPLFGQAMANAVFKAEHDTRTPMRMALLANVINLVLDPLLIYSASMGVTGAAVATLTGRTIALGVSLAVLYRAPLTRQLRRLPRATGSAAREILQLGWPSSAEFLTRMIGGMLLTAVVARFGATALAAYGVGYKILLLSTMAFYSVRQAATIHTARGVAQTGLQALPVIGKATLAAGVAAGVGAAALWSTAAPVFVGLFRPDPEVAAAAVVFLRVMAVYVVPLSGLISLSGVFIGAGRSEPLFPLTAAGVALQFALAVVLGRSVGLAGVWAAMVVSTLLQAVALHALFRGWLAPGKLVPEGVMQE